LVLLARQHQSAALPGSRTQMKHDAARHLEYRIWQNGNSELRAELYRLTHPPEGADFGWLDVQVREMEALNERISYSVRLHTRFSPPIYEVNCFMFALGIEADAVSDMRLGPVFP